MTFDFDVRLKSVKIVILGIKLEILRPQNVQMTFDFDVRLKSVQIVILGNNTLPLPRSSVRKYYVHKTFK